MWGVALRTQSGPIRQMSEQRHLRHRREAAPVQRRGPMHAQRFHMFGGAISGIAVPAVMRVGFGGFAHQTVAMFLGEDAGSLKVTVLAKWKTTAQMIAIATLFSQGIFEHHSALLLVELEASHRSIEDVELSWSMLGTIWAGRLGLCLLWGAALLTLLTGWDYFQKALPLLKEKT